MNYEPFDITRSRDYERALQRVATRGIVQLFNTVRKQQQTSASSSSSSKKKDKKETTINKGEFLDMLKTIDSDEVACKVMKKNSAAMVSDRTAVIVPLAEPVLRLSLQVQPTTKSAAPVRWSVLQDDLMASVQDDEDDD